MKRRGGTVVLAEGRTCRGIEARKDRHRRGSSVDAERLLDGEAKWRKGREEWNKFRVKGYGAQRIGENGEALRYIEMVLRQLRRASRDHRKLVEQRSSRVAFLSSSTPCLDEYLSGRCFSGDVRGSLAIGRGQERRMGEKKSEVSRETVERLREVGGSRKEEPRELAEYPCVDVARKVVARRKPYARGIYLLETMPRRIHERMSVAGRHGLRGYVPAYEGIDTTIIR